MKWIKQKFISLLEWFLRDDIDTDFTIEEVIEKQKAINILINMELDNRQKQLNAPYSSKN